MRLAAIAAGLRGHVRPALAAAILAAAIYGFLLNRIRKAHFSWEANALSLPGLPLFSYLLLRSKLSHKRGKRTLEGKDLRGGANHAEADAIGPPSRAQLGIEFRRTETRMVYLTRKAEFAASHYYHNPDFTPEENQRIFGKCNNPNGHGHNYTLEVTVKGEVDPRSGFRRRSEAVERNSEPRSAGRHGPPLSEQRSAGILHQIPTTENLAIAIWQRLAPKLKAAQLHRVRVYETPDLFRRFLR